MFFQLYFLEHIFIEEGDSITCFELFLIDMNKSFNNNCINIFLMIFFVQLADCIEQIFINLFTEFYSFLDLFTRSSVILLVEVEICVHEKFNWFKDVNIIVPSMFDQFVVLYSHINLWKFFLVSVVEVSLFDPFIHQCQGNLIFLIFILSYFVVIVSPSGLVH